jgi:hypothetical protein
MSGATLLTRPVPTVMPREGGASSNTKEQCCSLVE